MVAKCLGLYSSSLDNSQEVKQQATGWQSLSRERRVAHKLSGTSQSGQAQARGEGSEDGYKRENTQDY